VTPDGASNGATGAQKLSLLDATLLVMGSIVGIGIFFTPQAIAAQVREPWAYMTLWVFGGLIALCAAWTFAELAGTYPRSGGWFVYLREAFGEFPAYLFAWVVLFVVSTGAMAAIIGFTADMLHAALPTLVGEQGSFSHHAAALSIILGLTGLTLCGVRRAARLQNVCMIVKTLVLLGLAIAGLVFTTGDASSATDAVALQPLEPLTSGLPGRMVAALLPIFFTFGGWQLVCYLAPEIRDPERSLPRAIVGGVLGVMALYLLANAAFLRGLGTEELARDPAFAATLARSALGTTGERLFSAGIAISAIGVCAVNVITGPWLYVAMAREKLFFSTIGRIHPSRGVPVNALLLQAALVLVYYFGSKLQDLVSSVVFVEWIFHGLAALALIRLRRRNPELPRPFRSPLYPLAPLVYAATAALVVGGTLWQDRGDVTRNGLIIIAIGTLIYRPWRALVARTSG
jgi:APA family basic amino acid/polyamine antiporter